MALLSYKNNVLYKGHCKKVVHSYPPLCPLQQYLKDILYWGGQRGRALTTKEKKMFNKEGTSTFNTVSRKEHIQKRVIPPKTLVQNIPT